MSVGEEDYTQYDYFAEAKAYEARGDDEKAIEFYTKAIEIDPNFAKAWFYKAQLLAKLGRHEEALKCAREAVRIRADWEKHVKRFIPDFTM